MEFRSEVRAVAAKDGDPRAQRLRFLAWRVGISAQSPESKKARSARLGVPRLVGLTSCPTVFRMVRKADVHRSPRSHSSDALPVSSWRERLNGPRSVADSEAIVQIAVSLSPVNRHRYVPPCARNQIFFRDGPPPRRQESNHTSCSVPQSHRV
jgi:hypothetical protein